MRDNFFLLEIKGNELSIRVFTLNIQFPGID